MSDKKKTFEEFTTEELLAALEEEDTQQEVLEDHIYLNSVVNFINHYKITAGDETVSKPLLYRLYRLFTNDPVDARQFSATMNQFFHHYSNSSGYYYKINLSSLQIIKSYDILVMERKQTNFASVGTRNHFEAFLKAENIIKGAKWFQGFFIHDIYRDYCRKVGKKQLLSYQRFIQIMMLYFDHRRVTSDRSMWFKVDEETAKRLTEEERQVIINGRKKDAIGRKLPKWVKEARKKQKKLEKIKRVNSRIKSKNQI